MIKKCIEYFSKYGRLAASVLVLAGSLSAGNGDPLIINLVTTNDLHGVIGEQEATFMNPEYAPMILGGSAYYKYVEELRREAEQQNEGILLLDAGNFFQGSPLGMFDGGKTLVEFLNKMKYDALTPGTYDFSLGAENLSELAELANFPFLAANISCFDCPLDPDPFVPYVIKEFDGVRIGIIGIVHSGLEDIVLKRNIPGIRALNVVPQTRKWIKEVRNAGADVVILLTSTGVPWDREIVYQEFLDSLKTGWKAVDDDLNAMQLGYYAEGADIMISGGISRGYDQPWYDPQSHVYVFQNYGNGTEFGHIQLLIDRESRQFIGYRPMVTEQVNQTLLADDFQPDYEVMDWIRSREKQALEMVYQSLPIQPADSRSWSCSPRKPQFPRNDWKIPSVNLHDEFEFITWNCENFPADPQLTVDALSEAVSDLDADIIAFQEIKFAGYFSKLMAELPQYDFVLSMQSSYLDQAIIFKKDMFQLVRQVEPFAENDYNFAGRPPLMAELLYMCPDNSFPFLVVNLHMKCCDSGLTRRQRAAAMLHDYADGLYQEKNSKMIILGDWNDDLKDEHNAHCFHSFMDDDRFFFPTWDITHDISQASYPKEPYVSFLDHILISRDFLSPDTGYRVQTLPMDEYLGSYSLYETLISDHKPVLLGFPIPGK